MGSRPPKAAVLSIADGAQPTTQSLAERARQSRSDLIASQIEAAALPLFEKRGFANVTIDEIAAAAQISPRTFYRYFPIKEDVLQVRIRQRAEALRGALAQRPEDEPPLHAVRVAVEAVVSAEDPVLLERWITIVAATPHVIKNVIGGNVLALNRTMAEFFAARLEMPSDALTPAMLAAAAGGILQAAQTRWHLRGGNLANIVSEGLRVLEEGVGTHTAAGPTGNSGAGGRPRRRSRRRK